MNAITRTGYLPLPPTSYRDPFSEEARPSPSSHFHIHLNPHSCPTIGEHFNSLKTLEIGRALTEISHMAGMDR